MSTLSMAVPTEVSDTETSHLRYDHPAASSPLTIVANTCQQGNPLLQHLKELRVEYSSIVPDYLIDSQSACIFISLKFHRLNTDYLKTRVSALGRTRYRLRLLLCLVDLPDFEQPLETVTLIGFQSGMSFFLAWTPAEAARHLESFKHLIDKPSDTIQERLSENTAARISAVLTTIPTITSVDSVMLMRQFGTLRRLLKASKEELAECPGIGQKKVRHLWRVLHEPLREEDR